MVRRKAPPQNAPTTLPEAIDRLKAYLGKIAAIERLKADADKSIATIEAARDAATAPLEIEVKDLFLELRAWWAVAGEEMTEGKRKSIELAGALIGQRTTPHSLKLPRGKPTAEIVDDLLDALGGDFLITTNKLDKAAIVKTLRLQLDPDDPDDAIALREQHILGTDLSLTVTQREEFFIDRAAPKQPDPETVATPAPAIVEARS